MGSVLVGELSLLQSLLVLLSLLLVLWLLLRLGLRLVRHYWVRRLVAIAMMSLLLLGYSMRVLWVMVVELLVVLVFGLGRPSF